MLTLCKWELIIHFKSSIRYFTAFYFYLEVFVKIEETTQLALKNLLQKVIEFIQFFPAIQLEYTKIS